MIITRYLIAEIARPLAVTLGILATLFGSYSAAGFLADAVNGLLPTEAIAILIALKVLIALEVLIPISLYIAVVLAFGRLNSDSEMTAMFALRVTPARVMGAVAMLAGALAILVAGLSVFARPWAYRTSHETIHRAEGLLNMRAMEAGTFYVGENGDRVIHLTRRDSPDAPARDIFVRLNRGDHTEVIYARLAYQMHKPGEEGSNVYLGGAHIYDLAKGGRRDRMLAVDGIVLNPNNQALDPLQYKSASASTPHLLTSRAPEDVAELQWRFSNPISTLLLGLLAVPLSRARPRQSRYTRMGTAILVYSAYYLLSMTARTWVQHGSVAPLPGLWWAPGLLALTLAGALVAPDIRLWFARRTHALQSVSP